MPQRGAEIAEKKKKKKKKKRKWNGDKKIFEALLSETDDRDQIFKLCDVIRETGFQIHKFHRYGHLEKVYENARVHRLRKLGQRSSNSFRYLFTMKMVQKLVTILRIFW